jgi:DNA-binding SARP family transcriptional activator/TolB-like protein
MIELHTLGGLDLCDAGGHELRSIIRQPKRFALLAYLAQAQHRPFRRRDTITALFWPELDQEHARGALRQAVRFLRRELEDEVLVTRGDEEIGVDFAGLHSDAHDFEQACRNGRNAEALTLYRGDFLDGLFVSGAAPELEQWIDQERSRLRDRASAAAWALAAEHRAAGDSVVAAVWARRAARFASESEIELTRLIRFLDDLGDRVGALAAHDEFVRHLQDEYGAAPSPETEALIRAVRERTNANAPGVPEPSRVVSAAAASQQQLAAPVRRGTSQRALVALALVGVISVSLYLIAFRPSKPPVVAVLPVRTVDSTDEGLADEATDELITNLARVSALQVINTSTMMHYRDSTPQQLARARRVDAVLVAALRPRGDSIRLTTQLVLIGSDQAVWAESFDGSRGDLIRMQRDVARQVAERVTKGITARERVALKGGRAVPPQALDAFVRGRFWWNRRTRDDLFRAIGAYNQALELEPTFALAYGGLGEAYAQLGYTGFLRPEDAFPKAQAAARQALALDSTLAAPHATLGFVAMYYDWDWQVAEHEYREALSHNPSYATAHEWYGLFLAAMGRFNQAQAEELQARVLDPLSVPIAATAGWVLHYSGKQREAESVLRMALRMNSAYPIGHLYLGRVLQFQGKADSALAHFAMMGPLRTWIPNLAGEAYVYAQAGRRQEALAVLARFDSLARTQYVTAYAVALVHAALGDREEAFTWLDQAVRERTHWVLWLNRDRRWDPIRSDARFEALTRRVGLPD